MRTFLFIIVCIILPICLKAQDSLYAIKSEGFGQSSILAEKAALRNAVEKTIGLYLESTTLVNNNQLIEDKILTFSNGFVSSYKVLKVAEENDLFRIEIEAKVAKTQIKKKLIESGLNVREVDGTSLFGEAITKIDRQLSGITLVESAISTYPKNAYVIKLSPPEIKSTNSQSGEANVQISAKISSSKQWINNFKEYLSKITLSTSPQINENDLKSAVLFINNDISEVLKQINIDPEISKKLKIELCKEELYLQLSFKNAAGDTILTKDYLLRCLIDFYIGSLMPPGQRPTDDFTPSELYSVCFSMPMFSDREYFRCFGHSTYTSRPWRTADVWNGIFFTNIIGETHMYDNTIAMVSNLEFPSFQLHLKSNLELLKQVTSMSAYIITK